MLQKFLKGVNVNLSQFTKFHVKHGGKKMDEPRKQTEKQITLKLYEDQLREIDDLRWGLRYESRAALARDLLDIGLMAFMIASEYEGVRTITDVQEVVRRALTEK
jgi:hypothetical protein